MESKWIDKKSYCNLLCNIKAHSLYHSREWIELIENSFNVTASFLATYDQNSKIICVTPYFKLRKFLFILYGSPLSGLFTMFQGPIFIGNLSDLDVNKVLTSQHEFLSSRSYYIEIGFHYSNKINSSNNQLLKNNLYKIQSRTTSVINLEQTQDFIWNNFESRARNMVRKSIKNGVKVTKQEMNITWVEQFYDMLNETYKKQSKRTPHPFNFYKNLIMLNNLNAVCFSATIENKIIANAIFITSGSELLFLSGTSNNQGMKLAANSLIQWQAITYGIETGHSSYDFGGLGLENIDKFKMSFNGKITQHQRLVYKSKIIKILEPILYLLMKTKLFNITSK